MKNYYTLTTFLLVLFLCFAITGCFGNNPKEEPKQTSETNINQTKQTNLNYLETLSDSEKQSIVISCKSNLKNIGTACEMYAADHNGFYPTSLDELTTNRYISAMPVCPLDSSSSYKYVSKKQPDYYILKCPNHKIIFDSITGLTSGEEMDSNSSHKSYSDYYNSIKSGSIDEYTKFTEDDLKELGIK